MIEKSVLGIVPARGGSKRVPRKNIREIAGKPLIYYTIEAARKSKVINRLIVSSDSPEIIEYARSQDVETPFTRPEEISSDSALSVDVALHAIDYIEKHEQQTYGYVCLLEPTCPFRKTDDIDSALNKLIDSDFDSLIGLIPTSPPCRVRYIENGEVIMPYKNEYIDFMKNKSKYPQAYVPGGGIFCAKVEEMRQEHHISPGKIMPYVFDCYNALDIDTVEEFKIAECLLKEKMNIQ